MADTDTPIVPETVVTKPLETPSVPVTPTTPVVNVDVEAAKKEAEQARMRANQLENQLAEANKRIADAAEAKLKETEDYKTLYEQTNAKLVDVVTTQEQQVIAQEVAKKEAEIVSQYPEAVLKIAQTAGLKLDSVEADAEVAYKAKLDELNKQVGGEVKNRPENHSATNADLTSRAQAMERVKAGEKDAMVDVVSTLGFIKAYDQQTAQ